MAAILVCPGGAFTTRAVDFEGVLVARWLNEHGIAAFVLRYRIRPLYQVKDAVADGHLNFVFRGPLPRLLEWLARQPVADLKVEPQGLAPIYRRFHG